MRTIILHVGSYGQLFTGKDEFTPSKRRVALTSVVFNYDEQYSRGKLRRLIQ